MAREPMPSVALLKDIPAFDGFPEAGRRFLAGLALKNEKSYFDAHRETYEQALLAPMRAFVVEAGRRLRPQVPRIVADPRVGGSVFRMARDTRFSSDKTPYKEWLSARLWDGSGPGKDSSGSFYIQVDALSVYVGGGVYRFEDDQLERFRTAVTDDRTRKELERIVAKLPMAVEGKALQRWPRGYSAEHPAGEWLKFKGLYAGGALDGRSARGPKLLDHALAVYLALVPLHDWLMRNVVIGPTVDDD